MPSIYTSIRNAKVTSQRNRTLLLTESLNTEFCTMIITNGKEESPRSVLMPTSLETQRNCMIIGSFHPPNGNSHVLSL